VDDVSPEETREMLEYFDAIVWITSPLHGRSPNRSRAIAGQIARNAIRELRRPKLVELESDARNTG
jgi:hypothetical protein